MNYLPTLVGWTQSNISAPRREQITRSIWKLWNYVWQFRKLALEGDSFCEQFKKIIQKFDMFNLPMVISWNNVLVFAKKIKKSTIPTWNPTPITYLGRPGAISFNRLQHSATTRQNEFLSSPPERPPIAIPTWKIWKFQTNLKKNDRFQDNLRYRTGIRNF